MAYFQYHRVNAVGRKLTVRRVYVAFVLPTGIATGSTTYRMGTCYVPLQYNQLRACVNSPLDGKPECQVCLQRYRASCGVRQWKINHPVRHEGPPEE